MKTHIEINLGMFDILILGSDETGISTAMETACEQIETTCDQKEDGAAYFLLTLDEQTSFRVRTTSKQESSEITGEQNTETYDGLIILLDGSSGDALDSLQMHIAKHKELNDTKPVIIGVTQLSSAVAGGINHFRQMLDPMNLRVPLYEIDVSSQRDVLLLFRTFLACETVS